jgi:phage anti-repressor protein
MCNTETVQTDFVLDANQVSKWLGVTKQMIVKTLRESYTQKVDYIIEHAPNKKGRKGSNNYKKVTMTPDCFKRLSMRSRSKRAEEVRTYFILLESLIIKYKDFIIQGMDKQMQQMERSLKPKDQNDGEGYVYVIKASPEKDSVYKIGRTGSWGSRMATYNTGTVDGVEVLFRYRTSSYKAVERCVKALIKEHQLRKYKEVYQINVDMIKMVIEKCDAICQLKKEFVSTKAPKMAGGYFVVLSRVG